MSFFISDALAAGTPAIQQPGMEGLLFPVGILVFFYFLFLRPQAQRSKEKKQMIAAMNIGAEVVTSGGILGKVAELDDNFVKLEVGEGVFIQVQRQSI
jgi:preprotein translocase subunit YajC